MLNSGISTLTLGRLQNEQAKLLAMMPSLVYPTVPGGCPASPSPESPGAPLPTRAVKECRWNLPRLGGWGWTWTRDNRIHSPSGPAPRGSERQRVCKAGKILTTQPPGLYLTPKLQDVVRFSLGFLTPFFLSPFPSFK